jgi:hypothetical protein
MANDPRRAGALAQEGTLSILVKSGTHPYLAPFVQDCGPAQAEANSILAL